MKREISIILIRPRDPNNIGAVARAMANFGLSDLRIVDPYAPTWQAAVSAVGAQDILAQARLFDTLPQALADCTHCFATTALKNRQLGRAALLLPDLPQHLADLSAGRVGLVFGNEKTGLSNQDIALCTYALHIPTAAKQPSVNLAQAVILTCYELARTVPVRRTALAKAPTKATFAETELVVAQLERLMQHANLKTDYTADQRRTLLRTLISKTNLSKNDLFFIKKLAEQLQEK